jgi:hypothetical protein
LVPVLACSRGESTKSSPLEAPGLAEDTVDLFNANVVVHLVQETVTATGTLQDNCTGTLVTRTRVLTAGHCILGGNGNRAPAWGTKPPIVIGDVRLGSTASVTIRSAGSQTALSAPVNSDDKSQVAHDIALVALDEAALDRELLETLDANRHTADPTSFTFFDWTTILETHVVRPSFSSPGHPAFVAGWSPLHGPLRQVGEVAEYQLDHGLWSFAEYIVHITLEGGDSGGPLFVVREDGSRDTVGVHSVVSFSDATPQTAFFADITAVDNAAWLRDRLVDHSHDDSSQATWKAMHPMPPGEVRWIGEDEYSGPCQIKRDADCDHWFAEHDNCPTLFNHDQADSDDDGIGNACE